MAREGGSWDTLRALPATSVPRKSREGSDACRRRPHLSSCTTFCPGRRRARGTIEGVKAQPSAPTPPPCTVTASPTLRLVSAPFFPSGMQAAAGRDFCLFCSLPVSPERCQAGGTVPRVLIRRMSQHVVCIVGPDAGGWGARRPHDRGLSAAPPPPAPAAPQHLRGEP